MSLPYFLMFPDDFEADTAHLTLAEDGAYNRLLRLCWRTPGCSLPHEEAWIMRKMRALTDADIAVVRVVLDEFFRVEKGRIFNPRLREEWVKANEAHERRVRSGSKGGAAKALKNNDPAASNAKAMLKQPEPYPLREKEEPNGSSKKQISRGSRLPRDWQLPRPWGQWAVDAGMAETRVRSEAEVFRDYWIAKPGKDGTKLDWEATWRNWIKRCLERQSFQQPTRQPEFWTGRVL